MQTILKINYYWGYISFCLFNFFHRWYNFLFLNDKNVRIFTVNMPSRAKLWEKKESSLHLRFFQNSLFSNVSTSVHLFLQFSNLKWHISFSVWLILALFLSNNYNLTSSGFNRKCEIILFDSFCYSRLWLNMIIY